MISVGTFRLMTSVPPETSITLMDFTKQLIDIACLLEVSNAAIDWIILRVVLSITISLVFLRALIRFGIVNNASKPIMAIK
jgi:hypothetical protein